MRRGKTVERAAYRERWSTELEKKPPTLNYASPARRAHKKSAAPYVAFSICAFALSFGVLLFFTDDTNRNGGRNVVILLAALCVFLLPFLLLRVRWRK